MRPVDSRTTWFHAFLVLFVLFLFSRSDKLLAVVLLVLEVTCYWWQQLAHFSLQRTAVDTNATEVLVVKFDLASPFFMKLNHFYFSMIIKMCSKISHNNRERTWEAKSHHPGLQAIDVVASPCSCNNASVIVSQSVREEGESLVLGLSCVPWQS